MTVYGYMRVSTDEQNHDLQFDALQKAGCEKVFSDTITGASTKRPELDMLLTLLDEGDTLAVWKLDRLGRKASFLYDLVENLNKRGIYFKSITESFDTSNTMGWAMFQMMGVFAELERNQIKERTKAGVQAAIKKKGKWGKPSIITPEDEQEILKMAKKGWSLREIAKLLPYSHSTVHRVLAKNKLKEEE